jgi:O-antigen ligase
MLIQLAKICIYIALASPLIASKSLFFPFITGKIIFFRVFTELALLCIIGALAYGKIPLSTLKNTFKRPIFLAVSIFTALFTLSALTAQNPSFAFWSNFERGEGAWQIIHYFVFFCLILVLFKDKNDWKRIIGVQTIIGTLVGLYAVGQAVNWPKWIIDPPTGAVSGTLGNPDYLGIYMIISGFFALWLAYENRENKRLFWFLCAAFEIALFFAAKSRGSFVGVGIGLIFMLFVWLFQQKRSLKSTGIAAIAAIIIICGAGALILTVKGDAIAGIQPRLWTWQSALTGVIERPLTGWGPENFPFIFDAYYNPKHYQIESWFDRAHDIPLEYLTAGGIPLLLAYLGIFAVLYYRLLRRKKDKLWPFFSVLPLIYFINGIVLFETLPLYIIFFLLVAATDAYTDDFKAYEQVKNKHNNQNGWLQAILAVTAFGIAISLYTTDYLPFEKNIMILDTMRTDGKTDVAIFKGHEATLQYSSPVGQQEELQGLLTFTVSYFDYLQSHKLTTEVSNEKIANIMKFNAEWYEKLKNSMIGVKTLYIRITGLLGAYQITKDAAYLKEADILIAEGAAIAPTRIEFVRFTMASAQLHNDAATYAKALEKGKRLLPTLTWEADMAKFKY